MPHFNKGRVHSPEIRAKMSAAKMGKPSPKKGIATGYSYWAGKKRTNMMGEKHPLWKGGYEYKLFVNRRRKAQKRANGGSHTFGEWMNLKAQHNYCCVSCAAQEPSIKLTQDHIIAISRGGSDNIENIQPLCTVCNSRKGAR